MKLSITNLFSKFREISRKLYAFTKKTMKGKLKFFCIDLKFSWCPKTNSCIYCTSCTSCAYCSNWNKHLFQWTHSLNYSGFIKLQTSWEHFINVQFRPCVCFFFFNANKKASYQREKRRGWSKTYYRTMFFNF